MEEGVLLYYSEAWEISAKLKMFVTLLLSLSAVTSATSAGEEQQGLNPGMV